MDQVFIKDSMLKNHIHKCRCCLKKFEFDSQTVQVTKLIEKLFYDFTGIEVNETITNHKLATIPNKTVFLLS